MMRMTKKMNYSEYFSGIRRKEIGLVSGCFDLTHAGHYLFFEQCRNLCDYLCVFVAPDKGVRKNKGSERPYQNQFIRLEQVRSCRYVDDAIIGLDTLEDLFDELIVLNNHYNKTDSDIIYFVNEDAYRLSDRIQFCEDNSIQIQILERTCPPEFDNISTTKIAEKIIQSNQLLEFPAPTYEQLKMALEMIEAENIQLREKIRKLENVR